MEKVRLVRIEAKNDGIVKIPFTPYTTPIKKLKVSTALLTKIIMDDRLIITEISEDGLSAVRLTPINVGKKQVQETIDIVDRRPSKNKTVRRGPKVPKIALSIRSVSREDVIKRHASDDSGTEVPLGIDFR